MRSGCWFALALAAASCGWNGSDNVTGPGGGAGMTVAERNAMAPAPGGSGEGGAFWCISRSGGAPGTCFASREECGAYRRERDRDGLRTPACQRRVDDAWCRERCDDDGQCSTRCYASADDCSVDGAGCVRSGPPLEPFQPIGKRWWCYAASTLGVCYRQESACRYYARQRGKDGTAVTDCSTQPRAACVVMEDSMRDRYTVSCFASTTDCSFAAERSTRDPDHRVVRSCAVWE
jgi:hypothetical protein